MALSIAISAALATTAYLDAKFHIRHDLENLAVQHSPATAVKYLTKATVADRLLTTHILEDRASDPSTANNIFLLFSPDGRQWTYGQFWQDVCKVGNWLVEELGVQKNEIVALDGGNSPEYLIAWFALDAIGAIPAFVNCHLGGQPLLHCVQLSSSRFLWCDSDIQDLIEPSRDVLEAANVKIHYYSPRTFAALPKSTPPDPSRRSGQKPNDIRSLIYTSGTTGMPKGTIMSTSRELYVGHAVSKYLGLKQNDRFYTCMPLYHGAAHGLCVAPAIHAGCSVALGRKFSHSTFWPEVRSSSATHIQYVGELARYLLNAPSHPLDRAHNVRMAWGNGMRPDVWNVFRTRFNIPVINELYAATDGVSGAFNRNCGDFGVGAIQVRGALWNWLRASKEKRIRVDVGTNELLRDDKTGFAVICGRGEPGETIYQLDPTTPISSQFAGYYNNPSASASRLAHDVFRKGDLWFRSGDMMRLDSDGRLYFVDRLGDTFRWKSENVSTNEVADLLGTFPGIDGCNVYGVAVPHADGRAGCAALVLSEGVVEGKFDFKGFADFAVKNLPRYAVPVFLRLVGEMQMTGTLKVQKGAFRKEGVDLAVVKDLVYWIKPGAEGEREGYVPFVMADWEKVKAGGVKL